MKAPSDHGDLKSILTQDHRKIDERLQRVLTGTCCLIGEEQREAAELLEKAKGSLLKHIEFEERKLFPALEQRSGLTPDSGPTAVMRIEHERFRQLLEQASSHLNASYGDGFRQALRSLQADLAAHNTKEERVLYPMALAALEPLEVGELAHEAQTLS